ncbi:glycosyl transferase [Oculatella sp. LEGE 06141]|uniref:glycosyl transferase n=1 Tax=Oculatella sp. LEGE 06141 TaxID=1828648 RepID=UPI00187FA9A2|nr:glycosyl transferase [Oculatella sp. LEGE 06141]MBE9180358.1 glycosyl transferase [Oculatella sp. LEGE 06141]
MPQPILYVAITNHGFGHVTRTASVVARIQQRCPEMVIILATTAPRWLLELYIEGDFILRPRGLDVGVVQSDSMTIDQPETLNQLRQIQQQARSIVAGEVTFLRQNRVGLVLADIPPLAATIAHAANVPCWMASNFGWDLVYRAWGGDFVEIADWIGEHYQQCDRLLRLPFHEPMSNFSTIEDIGLTGGEPRYSIEEMRDRLQLKSLTERTVLLTFGGLGLSQTPYHNIERFPDWQFITFDHQAPDLPNLLKITDRTYRPVDLMPLCNRIVSKPGYSTFAEACRLGIPIVSLTRDDFAEAAFLIEGIQNYAEHQIVPPAEFFEGDWQFLKKSPQPPKQTQLLSVDGNEAIAQAVIDYLAS